MKIVASSQGIKPSIPSIFRFMMYKAAVQRNLEVVDFLLSCGIPWDDKCVWAASCTGDIDFLVWIHNRGFHIDVNMILNAGLVLWTVWSEWRHSMLLSLGKWQMFPKIKFGIRRQICLMKVERFRGSEILLQSNQTGLEQTFIQSFKIVKLNMNVWFLSNVLNVVSSKMLSRMFYGLKQRS